MDSQDEQALRKRLARHLKGGQAFSPLDDIVERIPFENIGIVPGGLPYSFFQQFYHIRFSQYDILEYCRTSAYQAPDWPDDYWPDEVSPEDQQAWDNLKEKYYEDRRELTEMILDPSSNLFQPFKANPDHTLLREIELVIEHTAYHTGQLYIIERLLE